MISKKIAWWGAACTIAQAWPTTDVKAQETAAQSAVVLEPVVVTATRVPTELERSVASVSVIRREQLEAQQYTTLNDALRDVPSLVIANRGGHGTSTGLFLRGAKSEHTSVLLDGIPMPSNLAGSFNLETLSLENLERIEVLRGPVSGVYGGKSLGGVVNLISRTGKGLAQPEYEIFAEAGSHDTYREGASTRGAVGLFDYSLDVQRFDTNGHRANSEYGLSSAAGHFGFQLQDGLYAELNWRIYDAEVGVPGPKEGFGSNDPDDFLETDSFSLSPRVTWEVNEFWKQTFVYQYSEFDQSASNFNYSGMNNQIHLVTQNAEYQSDFTLSEKVTLSVGGVFQGREYTRFDKDLQSLDVDQQEQNWALFSELQWNPWQDLRFVAGARYDDYSLFGEETTWRAGVNYVVPKLGTVLHANYGTAFSPPSPQDFQPALYGNPYILNPELSEGWEIGVKQGFFENKLVLRATFFENELEQLIEYNPILWQLTQVDEARLRGVELGADLELNSALSVRVHYTYLDADNLTSDQRLLRRPRHQIHGSFTLRPHERVSLGLAANYLLDREDGFSGAQTDAEDYLNVKLTAQVQLTKNLQWFGRVENLLNESYEEAVGYPAYGRSFYTGLKLQF